MQVSPAEALYPFRRDEVVTAIYIWEMGVIRSRKLLQAAKGESCTLNTVWCNHNPETVVACHSNWGEDGKGKGLKAEDLYIAFGCSGCHDWLDRGKAPREEKRDTFHRGMKKTWKRLVDIGVIKIA